MRRAEQTCEPRHSPTRADRRGAAPKNKYYLKSRQQKLSAFFGHKIGPNELLKQLNYA
ncbi:hypothetical protein SGRA_0148 [Saprospira grandis str. Lewin]|uniref:Uncharacterized protein n=1 Tax=Saprospira grandis (strain Lewin) TaxID=984262 RepID=H6L520_SAPGL|nr:hypothetical protein SGRA_0148 [Saprospira grandis str. Lewin]